MLAQGAASRRLANPGNTVAKWKKAPLGATHRTAKVSVASPGLRVSPCRVPRVALRFTLG
jgi:hypothetical protein